MRLRSLFLLLWAKKISTQYFRRLCVVVGLLLPIQALALDYDDIVGVWTQFDYPVGSQSPTPSEEDINDQCDAVINVFGTTPSRKVALRMYMHDELLMAIDIDSTATCTFENSTLVCPSRFSVHSPVSELGDTFNMEITNVFVPHGEQQLVLYSHGTNPDGSQVDDRHLLARCPMTVGEVGDWLQDRPSEQSELTGEFKSAFNDAVSILDKDNEQLERQAIAGDTDSARHRGMRYILAGLNPMLGEADPDRGQELLSIAAENGDVIARSALAHSHVIVPFMKGEPANWKEFIKHHQIAADGSVPDSINSLAMVYYLGLGGTSKDYQKAGRLFQRAAYLGSVSANFNLSLLWGFNNRQIKNTKFIKRPKGQIALGHLKYAANSGHDIAKKIWNSVVSKNAHLKQGSIDHAKKLHVLIEDNNAIRDEQFNAVFTFKAADGKINFKDGDIIMQYNN